MPKATRRESGDRRRGIIPRPVRTPARVPGWISRDSSARSTNDLKSRVIMNSTWPDGRMPTAAFLATSAFTAHLFAESMPHNDQWPVNRLVNLFTE